MRSPKKLISERWNSSTARKKRFSWIVCLLLMVVPCIVIIIAVHSRNDFKLIDGIDKNDNFLSEIPTESKESLTRDVVMNAIRLQETDKHLEDLEKEMREFISVMEERFSGIETQLYNLTSLNVSKDSTTRSSTKDCKLIFTISSAHAGGEYLHEVFSNLPNVSSYYRSPPPMLGDDLLLAKTLGLDGTYHTRFQKKIPPIESQIQPGTVWFDSSHLFIESWYDVAMDYFHEKKQCDVRVIVLRRYWPQVLQLLLQEGFSQHERNLYHSYTSKIAILPPAPLEIQRYRAHEQIIWYLLDIEKQIEHFKQRYPNAQIVYTRVESLTSPNAFAKLLEMLDIPVPESLHTVHKEGQDWNVHNFSVSPLELVNIPEDLESQYVSNFRQIVSEYSKQGISFGELPSLDKVS